MSRSLWVAVLLIEASSQDKVKCSGFDEKNPHVLNEYFQKLIESPEERELVKNKFPEIGAQTYLIKRRKKLPLEITKYDLSDPIISEKFDWHVELFSVVRDQKIDNYDLKCFQSEKIGYIIIQKNSKQKFSNKCAKKFNFEEFKSYLVKKVNLFREYDARGAVIVDVQPTTFAIKEEENFSLSIIQNNAVEKNQKLCYIPEHYKNIVERLLGTSEKITKGPKKAVYLKVTVNREWHIYTLFTNLMADIYERISIKTEPNQAEGISGEIGNLTILAEGVGDYYEKQIEIKFRTFDWEDLLGIIQKRAENRIEQRSANKIKSLKDKIVKLIGERAAALRLRFALKQDSIEKLR